MQEYKAQAETAPVPFALAELVTTKGDGEKARSINSIHLTVPSLAWDGVKLKPSELYAVREGAQDNQERIDSQHEEAEPVFAKWARETKALCGGVFYDDRIALGWEGFNAVMKAVDPILNSLDLNESLADPFLAAKKYAAKAVKARAANDQVDYLGAIFAAINTEKASLDNIYTKALELRAEDFTAYICGKAEANGVDDEGFAKLKNKKKAEQPTA